MLPRQNSNLLMSIWKMRWCSGPTSTDERLSASRSLPRSLNRSLPISLNSARYPPHRAAASCGEFGRGPNFQSKTARARESRRSSIARFSRASSSRASATSASIEKSRSRDARSPIRWISSKALPPFSTRRSTRRSSDATAVRIRLRISRRSCVGGRFGFAILRMPSVFEPESLRLCREVVVHLLPIGLALLLVPDEILETNAAPRSNHPARDLPVLEQLRHERSRHVQEIRGLLRGQLGVNGHDAHRVPVRHLAEDADEELERCARHGHARVMIALGDDGHMLRRPLPLPQEWGKGAGSRGRLGGDLGRRPRVQWCGDGLLAAGVHGVVEVVGKPEALFRRRGRKLREGLARRPARPCLHLPLPPPPLHRCSPSFATSKASVSPGRSDRHWSGPASPCEATANVRS